MDKRPNPYRAPLASDESMAKPVALDSSSTTPKAGDGWLWLGVVGTIVAMVSYTLDQGVADFRVEPDNYAGTLINAIVFHAGLVAAPVGPIIAVFLELARRYKSKR